GRRGRRAAAGPQAGHPAIGWYPAGVSPRAPMGGLTATGLRRLLCVALLGASMTAAAQVVCPMGAKTWTGNTSNDWRTGSNWSPAGVPANGDSICFSTPNPTPALAGGPPPRLATIYV